MFNLRKKRINKHSQVQDVPDGSEEVGGGMAIAPAPEIEEFDMQEDIETPKIPIFINIGKGKIPWAGFELPESLEEFRDEIMGLGMFNPFKSRKTKATQFTKRIDNNRDIEDFKAGLGAVKMISPQFDFDESALDAVIEDFGLEVVQSREEMSPEELEEEQKAKSMIHEWKIKIRDEVFAIKDANISQQNRERTKKVIDEVDKELDELGAMIDEAGSQEFIKDFLDFSSQMYKYSFYNQMLIYLQNGGKGHFFETEGQWKKMGRMKKPGEGKAGIFVNIGSGGRRNMKPIDKNLSEEEQEEEKAKRDKYSGAPPKFKFIPCILSYEQTIPDPTAKKVFEPPTNDMWQEPNLEDSKSEALVHGLLDFSKTKGISVNLDANTGDAGGYSSGGSIAINGESMGIRRFSTTVHELAHEILHQKREKTNKDKETFTRQQKEIDAEATAWRVLKYFGYDPTSHAAYIALWKGGAEALKSRGKYITEASNEIIGGIRDYLEKYEGINTKAVLHRIHFMKEATFNLSKHRIIKHI